MRDQLIGLRDRMKDLKHEACAEKRHGDADDILIELIRRVGRAHKDCKDVCDDIIRYYNRLEKWYS